MGILASCSSGARAVFVHEFVNLPELGLNDCIENASTVLGTVDVENPPHLREDGVHVVALGGLDCLQVLAEGLGDLTEMSHDELGQLVILIVTRQLGVVRVVALGFVDLREVVVNGLVMLLEIRQPLQFELVEAGLHCTSQIGDRKTLLESFNQL
eukprot:COSAG03_NODE_870_length_5566_cov_355.528809_8_plen_155_part_00